MIQWTHAVPAPTTGGRRTLHEELVARLGQMIQDGELAAGERISEAALCARFQVSRTPLREALKVLAAEGSVVWPANRGPRVAHVERDEVVAAFELLGALERLIGEVVCARMSEDELRDMEAAHLHLTQLHQAGDRIGYFRQNQVIHARLAGLTRNAAAASVYDALQRRIYRARALSNTAQPRWNESLREHESIMAALRLRDTPGLVAELVGHSVATEHAVLQSIDAMPRGEDDLS